ncbi:methionyl-tRNA formyltransferase [Metamycoplasma hominis]|uniref:methionyl-tRNA formyltransferase n=1 Tax=Metamycoplasma hominis TaxID=2098 RepID=UPI003CF8F58E
MKNINNKINLVLAGTGQFSAKTFEPLLNDERFNVLAFISQPNRKLDRNKNVIETEIFKLAKQYDIKVFQPQKIKEILPELSAMDFDFFITASFGQFIPDSILKLPKKMPLNVHGSLLEKYRGAAPVQYALLNGDIETGITLIEMVKQMDAGDILKSSKVKIDSADTAIEVFDKLADVASKNLGNWLFEIYNGQYNRVAQDESKVTFAPKILNGMERIDQSENLSSVINKIRAFNDEPGAYLIYQNKRLKIFRASTTKISTPLKIKFNDGYLYLIEYQFEGKKRVRV